MSATLLGRIGWDLNVDDQTGHRDYRLRTLVETTSIDDGPQVAGQAPGIPDWGAYWTFGNENDPWAFCHPQASVTPHLPDQEGCKTWIVDQLFSTRPIWRCQDFQPGNPVFEPPKTSGSFNRQQGFTSRDKNGELIVCSNFTNYYTLPQPFSVPTVIIEMNSLFLDLPDLFAALNCVNDAPLWGLPARTWYLSNLTWNSGLFGVCNRYYLLRMEFYAGFWDHILIDQGSSKKATASGKAGEKFLTPAKNPTGIIPLDGHGDRLDSSTLPDYVYLQTAGESNVQVLNDYNFYSLGVPVFL